MTDGRYDRPDGLYGDTGALRAETHWARRSTATPFMARLSQHQEIDQDDLAALASVPGETRLFDANAVILPEGSSDDRIHVLVDGWAGRFKILENGSRQIPALLLPGDVIDLDRLQLGQLDYGTIALTRCTVATLHRGALQALFDRRRAVRDAFYRMMAVENSVVTQWAVCLGRRSARERLSHLLCELFARLQAVGRVDASSCAFHLTQEELSDVLGLTAVHVNRTLQGLRSEGLIELRDQRLRILNPASLRRIGGFDARYLHLHPAQAAAPARAATQADDRYAAV